MGNVTNVFFDDKNQQVKIFCRLDFNNKMPYCRENFSYNHLIFLSFQLGLPYSWLEHQLLNWNQLNSHSKGKLYWLFTTTKSLEILPGLFGSFRGCHRDSRSRISGRALFQLPVGGQGPDHLDQAFARSGGTFVVNFLPSCHCSSGHLEKSPLLKIEGPWILTAHNWPKNIAFRALDEVVG